MIEDKHARTSWQKQGVIHTLRSPYCKLHSVPVNVVHIDDGFWNPRMEANRKRAIPRLLELLEEHGVVDNFRRLSGRKKVERKGALYTDSDLYKWMEGAAFVLQSEDDPEMRDTLDHIIDDVLAAQGKDGYLNTYFVDERAGERFQRLESDHEFYCCGHLIQAAVAHYRATGETKLLDGAKRFADYLTTVFGSDKRQGKSGHPELEMYGGWEMENLTPEGLLGYSTLRYTSGSWAVNVSFPVVWKPVYSVEITVDADPVFEWTGSVEQDGSVTPDIA